MAKMSIEINGRQTSLNIEPLIITGLHAMSYWYDCTVEKVVEDIAGEGHPNLSLGVTLRVQRFFSEQRDENSPDYQRRMQRGNERSARAKERAMHGQYVSRPRPPLRQI